MEKKSLFRTIRSMFKKTTTTAAAVGVSCALAACSQTAAPANSSSSGDGQDTPASAPVSSSHRISSMTVSYGSGDEKTGEATYSFKRDDDGNLIGVELSGNQTGSCTYSIDRDGRVSSATIERQGVDTDTVTYAYDSDGRLIKEAHDSVYPYTIEYSYDSDGRLIAKSSNNQDGPYSSEYSYDGQGRLAAEKTTTVAPSATTVEYSYDADGNVVSAHTTYTNFDGSQSDGGSTVYAYTDGNLSSVSYDAADGMLPITYTYGDDGKLSAAFVGEEMGDYDAAVFSYDENGLLCTVEEKVTSEGMTDRPQTIKTSITYEKPPESQGSLANDVAVDVFRGPQRAMDTIHLVRLTQQINGVTDPTPFAVESAFVLQ